MQPAPRKLRSPLKWHGGKSYLARRIVELMPEHSTYVEPFAGGLSVLLNKPRVGREIAIDANRHLIGFWQALQDDAPAILERLLSTPYSEASFDWAEDPQASYINEAVRFVVRNRMSRGGLGKDFAWSDRLRGRRRADGPVPGEINSWDTFRASIPTIAERIAGVELCFCDAADELRRLVRFGDSHAKDTLVYADPPYLHSTRTHRKAYDHEMTLADHLKLLGVLASFPGMVLLSGYRSPLYDAALVGWHRVEFDMPNHSGQGRTKQRRTECVWVNPQALERIDGKALQRATT